MFHHKPTNQWLPSQFIIYKTKECDNKTHSLAKKIRTLFTTAKTKEKKDKKFFYSKRKTKIRNNKLTGHRGNLIPKIFKEYLW